MPSPTSTPKVTTYSVPSEVPGYILDTLRAHSRSANIVLAHLEKARGEERAGNRVTPNQFWLACVTTDPTGSRSLDLFLSCVQGPIGPYPVCIFTTLTCLTATDYIRIRLANMASELSNVVPKERVYAVFAPDIISECFANEWSRLVGVPLDSDPVYYHAWFAFCTRESLKPSTQPRLLCQLRLACHTDIPFVAELCRGFSKDSPPYVLTEGKALEEAQLLIEGNQLWVCSVSIPGRQPAIASIVAVTRTSERVAAITKVFTHPNWRQKGYAEALTRHVTQYLLHVGGKESVVLYVGRGNPAAHVYGRVGFVGLDSDLGGSRDIESWKELGFERSVIRLGFW